MTSCNESLALRTPQKRFAENENDGTDAESGVFQIERKTGKDKEKNKYSRKEKSLGQLSKNFFEIFGKLEEKEVSLDFVTQALGVERRRIYDIINILESMGVVTRIGKNHYYWYGLKFIGTTITKVRVSN